MDISSFEKWYDLDLKNEYEEFLTSAKLSRDMDSISRKKYEETTWLMRCQIARHPKYTIREQAIVKMFEEEWFPKIEPAKEYWYYTVWTVAPGKSISNVRSNIDLFVGRSDTLQLFYVDASLEKTDMETHEPIRPHYNVRFKSHKSIPKNRIHQYEKAGMINYQVINKHTEENWDNVGNYISKENSIEVLLG